MSTPSGDRIQLTTLQRRIIIAVAVGAAAIATIGFVGSYAAVRRLAEAKGFGAFARVFPVGLDAGILVLLALDLLLTWLRMPLAMLRHVAWLLTIATIAFNAAAAWPDPVGTGMHGVIPVLFVVIVEAARHAIGRTADLTVGRHMESVRVSRWLLDPVSTFLLWRRMKLWELRSYDDVIAIEQQRLIERARLRARYGRRWRSKAPVPAVLALRLTRYGRSIGVPIEGVLDIEHAAVGFRRPPTFEAAAAQAIDVVRVQPATTAAVAAVVQPDADARPGPDAQPMKVQPPAAAAVVQPQPDAQPTATVAAAAPAEVQPDASAQPQPDALVLDLAPMLAAVHSGMCAPPPGTAAQPTAPPPRRRALTKPSETERNVVDMQLPEGDVAFLDRAREINLRSLREDGQRASLRLLQNELGIGQRRATRLQRQLPDTLAAANAEAEPHAKEA